MRQAGAATEASRRDLLPWSAMTLGTVLLCLLEFGAGALKLLQRRREPALQFVDFTQAPRFHVAESDRPAQASEKDLRHHAQLEDVPVPHRCLGRWSRGR